LIENKQVAQQFYRLSSTMPPKTAARGQLHLASVLTSTENLQSPLGRETLIVTRGACVLPEDEIHDENNQDDKENTADMEEDLSDGQGDNLRDVLGDNLSKPEPTMQSEIASMSKMMEE